MINPMDLTGKNIIITGASSGIGKATASLISEMGGHVALIARNIERLQSTLDELGGDAHRAYSFDLADNRNIKQLLDSIVKDMGQIDGLAYCAGIANRCPVRMLKTEKFIEMLSVNTLGFIEMAKVLSGTNYKKDKASFVVVSSIASIKGEKGLLGYSMSKGAINSAVRVMAKELSESGVRINAVLPSWIKTEMADNILTSYGRGDFDNEMATCQYLGVGSAVDVANAITFLLSDASKFITGTELIVDGGYSS